MRVSSLVGLLGVASVSAIFFACTSGAPIETTPNSTPIVLDTTCSTGPARDPSVPLPTTSDTGQYPECTDRCAATNTGFNGIESYVSLPNGSCTGNGSCQMFAAYFCGAEIFSCQQTFICTCVDGDWQCAATEGACDPQCPEGGTLDAGPHEAGHD